MVLSDVPDILLYPLVTWHDDSWSFPLDTTAHLGNRATHLVLPRRGLRCSSESHSCISRAIGVSAMQFWVYPRWQIPFVRALCASLRRTTLQRLLAVDRSISHSVRHNQATTIAACERCEVRVTLDATIAHAGRSSARFPHAWRWEFGAGTDARRAYSGPTPRGQPRADGAVARRGRLSETCSWLRTPRTQQSSGDAPKKH